MRHSFLTRHTPKRAKQAATDAAEAVISSVSSEVVPPAELTEWKASLEELRSGASSGTAFKEALSQAPAWVSAVVTSAGIVVDRAALCCARQRWASGRAHRSDGHRLRPLDGRRTPTRRQVVAAERRAWRAPRRR